MTTYEIHACVEVATQDKKDAYTVRFLEEFPDGKTVQNACFEDLKRGELFDTHGDGTHYYIQDTFYTLYKLDEQGMSEAVEDFYTLQGAKRYCDMLETLAEIGDLLARPELKDIRIQNEIGEMRSLLEYELLIEQSLKNGVQ